MHLYSSLSSLLGLVVSLQAASTDGEELGKSDAFGSVSQVVDSVHFLNLTLVRGGVLALRLVLDDLLLHEHFELLKVEAAIIV